MKISLCTWVRDWPPIRQALPQNLALIAGRDAEICVTDLGSRDGTVSWLRRIARRNPQLRVSSRRLEHLHFARAYNLAFARATGEIVVCLDADNIIGPEYLDHVHAAIAADPKAFVHAWQGKDWLDGCVGRMAMHRDVFQALGGYDEALGPCGAQDLDLKDRAIAWGCKLVWINDPAIVGTAIRNDDVDKMRYIDGKYHDINTANTQRSQANIAAGRLVANRRNEP